jgi:hypothetical protein
MIIVTLMKLMSWLGMFSITVVRLRNTSSKY